MAALTGPWPVRIAWAALPLTVGPALGDALHERSDAVAGTASVLAWAVWAVGLLAVAVPSTTSLTVTRVAAPTVAGAVGWAAAAGPVGAAQVLAAAWAALVLVAAFAPHTGDCFADASAYGAERRLLLRPPPALLLAPVPLAWLVAVGPVVAGPLLVAAGRWVAGGLVLAAGLPLSVVASRALHGLSRRWVVLVPNGLVLHDLQAMADPVLFPRSALARLGPARPADAVAGAHDAVATAPVDLTLGALGLPLQLDLREPLSIAPRRGRRGLDVVEVTGVRFAPSRPGALLAEAAERRIPVG